MAAEGFGEVIVRADFQAHDPVDLAPSGRQHDHGEVAGSAHAAAQAQSIFLGKHDIQDQQIDTVGPHDAVHFLAILSHGHAKTALTQKVSHQPADFLGSSSTNSTWAAESMNQLRSPGMMNDSCADTLFNAGGTSAPLDAGILARVPMAAAAGRNADALAPACVVPPLRTTVT